MILTHTNSQPSQPLQSMKQEARHQWSFEEVSDVLASPSDLTISYGNILDTNSLTLRSFVAERFVAVYNKYFERSF